MLRITLRTVTFIAACRWCSTRTMSSEVVPCACEPLVEPEERRRHRAILLPQPLDELHREGRHQRAALETREVRSPIGAIAAVADAEQLVGQGVGLLPRRAAAHDALAPGDGDSRRARPAA